MASIKEILEKSLSERKSDYEAKDIGKVIIDNNTFSNYSAFSFLYEKSYLKSPVRSNAGTIANLNSYPYFITPHLKINFGLMSIDDYRTLMKLVYSKNEFTVQCYDVVYNTYTTQKMYFSTEEMPKLWAIARALNGEDSYVELLGIQNYTVEMIGTNTDVETINITYRLNTPKDVSWSYDTEKIVSSPTNIALPVGDSAIINVNGVETRISNITFSNAYKFLYWSEKADGNGIKYVDSDAYMFNKDITLYAIWQAGAK